MEAKQTLNLGTAVHIQTLLNKGGATSVSISIKDTTKTTIVSGASMTKLSDTVYEYIWQSLYGTHQEGEYKIIINVVYNGKTSREISYFILEDIDTT